MLMEALAGFGTAAVIVYVMHRRAVRRRIEIIGGVAVMCAIVLNDYKEGRFSEAERDQILHAATRLEKNLRRANMHSDQQLAAWGRHCLEIAEEERELKNGPLVKLTSTQRQLRDKIQSMIAQWHDGTDQTG